ncbi:hypothetical protein [Bacillus amyloliquefaciens]|uniref:Uncharacterized protein n=1 Tax=Bacillus amyloliquefaciens TaxID=1390 RepID=A0AAP3YIY5_BACAM|nr:hypothetical protein [Bacillus amyloliquefaciens]MDF4195949.1 hypothetical protein [Bacillus amyloliquefaciens]MDF4215037.1 hypothetical protein [Bacillus amyloliquefaciens]
MTFKLKNGGESIMTKHTKKGGSHNKQNSKNGLKNKTSGSANGQNGYH